MARTIDSAKRVISGTHGAAWLDGEKMAETTALQAKLSKNKETINLCGQFISLLFSNPIFIRQNFLYPLNPPCLLLFHLLK